MLVEHVIESKEAGLLESILMPFDIYNDAADYALRSLKQRFLYDEIEAEVNYSLCSETSHIFSVIVMEVLKFVNYLLLYTADMRDAFQVLSVVWVDVLGILVCISPADWVTVSN